MKQRFNFRYFENCGVLLCCITYINVVNIQDLGVEVKPHGLGLLDWVCQLTVCLHTQ